VLERCERNTVGLEAGAPAEHGEYQPNRSDDVSHCKNKFQKHEVACLAITIISVGVAKG